MAKRTTQLPRGVEHTLSSIDTIALRHVPIDPFKPGGGKQPKLRDLLTRARALLEVELTSPSQPDGFAPTTPGNGSPGGGRGGGPTLAVPVPKAERRVPQSAEGVEFLAELHPDRLRDPLDLVPLSSVERAAFLAGGPREPLRVLAADAVRTLHKLSSALAHLEVIVDRWDRLRDTAGLDNPSQCWVASVTHRLPFDEKWAPHRRTTFEGYLDSPWKEERPVCRMVYDFTREHHRLPSKDEMTQYLARSVVRLQTGTSTTRAS